MPQKLNNRRRYPEANHQPFHKAKSRKEDSLARQAEYDKLTVEQKIKRLDDTLGVGVGAVKQRARLQALLNKKAQTKVAVATVASEQTNDMISGESSPKQEKQTKKYMKGAK